MTPRSSTGWNAIEALPSASCCRCGRVGLLRYGENPHQQAAIYVDDGHFQPWSVTDQGKAMSFNNYLDARLCLAVLCTIVQAGCGDRQTQQSLRRGDRSISWRPSSGHGIPIPLSAFGGVVAFNRALGLETARRLSPAASSRLWRRSNSQRSPGCPLQRKRSESGRTELHCSWISICGGSRTAWSARCGTVLMTGVVAGDLS